MKLLENPYEAPINNFDSLPTKERELTLKELRHFAMERELELSSLTPDKKRRNILPRE